MLRAAYRTYRLHGDAFVRVATLPPVPGSTTRLKRSLARLIRRIGRSPIGMMLPADVKRRGVNLAKKVLGDATLQARVERKSGIQIRRLGLAVSLDGPAGRPFASERLVQVEPNAAAWADATHLDALVTLGFSNAEKRLHVDRLEPCRVDPRVTVPPVPDGITPLGFDLDDHTRFATFGAPDARRVPPGWPLDRLDPASLPDPLERPDKWSRAVQPYLALVDHPDDWDDPVSRATTLGRFTAAGVPVVVAGRSDLADLDDLVPAPVLDAVAATDAFDVTDPLRRDRASATQWAAAHDHLTARPFWDRVMRGAGRPGMPVRSASVIVATNRPDMIENWAPQIAAQAGVQLEAIAVLHGSAFTDADAALAADLLGDRGTVLRAPGTYVLGELLAMAAGAAAGDLIVKWDDDDLYDRHHVADLIRAHEYSGATLVGKACEYVYLAGPDVTVRRDQGRRETFSATLAGGTLCIDRGDLAAIGGWRRAPRRVDSLLIEDVLAAGGLAYRAIGFGYVMRRAGATGHVHTWNVTDDVFLDPTFEHRRGLDADFAGVDAPAGVMERWR